MSVTLKDMLTLQDFADDLGVEYHTLVVYKTKGKLPPPDAVVGRSPLWARATVTKYKASRPGPGAGGGRKVDPAKAAGRKVRPA